MHFEWPRDLLAFFQEQGQGSCSPGMRSTCILYPDLSSCVYLMSQLLTTFVDHGDTSPSSEGVKGYNPAISPCQNSTQGPKKKAYPLRPKGGRSLRAQTLSEIHEVLLFFCLDLGCQHARGEAYLSTGYLDGHEIEDRCDSTCSICTQKWHKQILPVYHSEVVLAFLEYLIQTGKLPHDIDFKLLISSILAGSSFWKEIIFDPAPGGISQLQVDTLFLSLLA